MKKTILLILPLIISLGACNNKKDDTSSQISIEESSIPFSSEESSFEESIPAEESIEESIPVEGSIEETTIIEESIEEVIVSEEENAIPSEEEPVAESIEESLEESILPSEEESVLEESDVISEKEIDSETGIVSEETFEEPVSEDSVPVEFSIESEPVEGGTHVLLFEDVPAPNNGQYPAPGEVTSTSGDRFYLDTVMKGGGDYANHIQMKKEVSYIYNLTPVQGTLMFNVLKQTQYYNNEDHDFTGVPTVYAGTSINSVDEVLTPKVGETNDGHISYVYEAGAYTYYKIANESKYALYVNSFTWAY
ncbi:MAG: hypothetical protein IJQ67_02900 [Bacilli bacterium]|nr:hypothetical protein [Bacilli bacterium]